MTDPAPPPRTLPEEVLLLLLDDETGRPVGLPGPAGDLALAGAALMELALAGRVDTDLDRLYLADARPTGDPVLDSVLARLGAGGEETSRGWIFALLGQAAPLRDALLARLVAQGVLRQQEDRFLVVFAERRYPKAAPAATEAVRARLRRVIGTPDDIPEPRDALLIGLCQAAGLVPLLVGPEAAPRLAGRIGQLARLEDLSRSLGAAVRDVYATLARRGAVP